jgi:hypothetical protein
LLIADFSFIIGVFELLHIMLYEKKEALGNSPERPDPVNLQNLHLCTHRPFFGGLTLAGKLAAMMSGKISLESEVGAGSTFTIEMALPAVA